MLPRTPLSVGLRAFEAAARHLSFTLAGQELHMTQGAVSRQIRLLEERLGQPLFERFTRRVQLTPVGKDYYLDVQRCLADLDKATQKAMRSTGGAVLAIRVAPTLGMTWLMPRLAGFVEAHPDVDVQITTSVDIPDLTGRGVDVVLGVGRVPGDTYPDGNPVIDADVVSQWRGIHAQLIAPDILVPVMSPELLRQGPPVRRPADLLRHPLIHTRSRRAAWDQWLQAHRVAAPKGERLTFGHYFMALRAAEDGRGVAIIPSILVPLEAWGKSLVQPCAADLPSAGAYYVACLKVRADEPAIDTFLKWVLKEAVEWRELEKARRGAGR